MKKDYDATENNSHEQVIDLEKQVKELQQLSNREKAKIIDAFYPYSWNNVSLNNFNKRSAPPVP